MMRSLALVFVLVSWIGCQEQTLQVPPHEKSGSSSSSGAQETSTTLRIANFNVHNLFNDKDDSDTQVAEAIETTARYQRHLAAVASALRELDADLVMLQEVENQAVLDDLRARSELEGRYSHTALEPTNDPRGIHIALLSSMPIESQISHRDDVLRGDIAGRTYRYARDLLEVHVRRDDLELVLLGVHFKAKDDFSAAEYDKRLAEARGARAVADGIRSAAPATSVVLLGDFNDDTDSPSTAAVRGGDPEFGHALAALPEGEQWTVDFGDGKMTYDDQWVSPEMDAAREPASVVVLHVPSEASDHAAVAATYTFAR